MIGSKPSSPPIPPMRKPCACLPGPSLHLLGEGARLPSSPSQGARPRSPLDADLGHALSELLLQSGRGSEAESLLKRGRERIHSISPRRAAAGALLQRPGASRRGARRRRAAVFERPKADAELTMQHIICSGSLLLAVTPKRLPPIEPSSRHGAEQCRSSPGACDRAQCRQSARRSRTGRERCARSRPEVGRALPYLCRQLDGTW